MRQLHQEKPKSQTEDRRQTPAEYEAMLQGEEKLKSQLSDLVRREEAQAMVEISGGEARALKVYDKNDKLIYFEDLEAIRQAFSERKRQN